VEQLATGSRDLEIVQEMTQKLDSEQPMKQIVDEDGTLVRLERCMRDIEALKRVVGNRRKK
jgi:hypothetical protein